MKLIIDLEQNDTNGNPVPSIILEDVKCFGLAAVHSDGLIFHHHGDAIAIKSALHGLDICMQPFIKEAQQKIIER